jgi:hypothetical protein
MGGAKQAQLEASEAEDIGIEIGLRAGVLDRCEAHGCWWSTGDGDEAAYRLASALIRDGDPLVVGRDRTLILDGVRSAISNAGIDGCAHCEHIMDND